MFAFIIHRYREKWQYIYISLLKAPDALDSVDKSLATSTRRGLTFLLQEDRDPVLSTWARFLSSDDRSNAKKNHQKTSGTSRQRAFATK